MSKRSRSLAIVQVFIGAICFVFYTSSISYAQINSFEVRFEGSGVYEDDFINGLPAMIKTETPVQLIISVQTANIWSDFCAPFVLYSPNTSVTEIVHTASPVYTTEWNAVVFSLSGGILTSFSSWDGILPDAIVQAGIGFGGDNGWSSPTLTDAITYSMSFPAGQNGVFCIDTALFPPAGAWILGPVGPADWGDNGGYAAGGYCITVIDEFPDCCNIAGDANHSGSVTIGDANAVLARIFFGASHPTCCREADINGDGFISVADVTYIIAYIFSSGPSPTCGPTEMFCGA